MYCLVAIEIPKNEIEYLSKLKRKIGVDGIITRKECIVSEIPITVSDIIVSDKIDKSKYQINMIK